jgi:hypothetical protein
MTAMKKLLRPLTRLLLIGLAPFTGWAQEEEPPYIIFISENTPAKTAAENLVIAEHNAMVREQIRVDDFALWEAENAKPASERFADFTATSFRNVPADFRNARYDEIMSTLGLQEDDPADKGFTDLLEAAGYTVYRSITIREEDPITGAVSVDQEFWGDIGEPFSETGDYRLSEEQIAFLSEADLIIVSMDVTPNRYSAGGRENGQASTVLIHQWNGLPVPIIVMHNELMATMEFGSWGWGLSYGFTRTFNTLGAFDRQEVIGEERFVFPDLRPKVRTSDPDLLAGVNTVDDDRLAIYKDYDLLPVLPRTQVKFSNNLNYNLPSTARMILELDIPSFVVNPVGDIPTRDPVMIEFQAGVPAFNPQDGTPVQERVAVPAATRLYFAAGSGAAGLYNLSEVGETVFLNAVAKYAGAGSGNGGNDWYGYPIETAGWANTGSWLNGWVQVDEDPWIWSLALKRYLYVPDDQGWIYIPR